MIEALLARDEGKTLEFKENCRSIDRIVRTAVAFANTAGGNIAIGIKDKTKDVVGIVDPLLEEQRLANAFADRRDSCGSRQGAQGSLSRICSEGESKWMMPSGGAN